MSLIYLASPYSHEDPKVRKERFNAAVGYTAKFILDGYNIYSPIVHGHYITEYLIHRTGISKQYLFEYNRKLCIEMIKKSDEFWILELDGWIDSDGINKERQIAIMLDMPIKNIPVRETYEIY